MTIKRKVGPETVSERDSRVAKTAVANFSPRSEKTSWTRKRGNLQVFIEKYINPIEQDLLEQQLKLQDLFAAVSTCSDQSTREVFFTQKIQPLQAQIDKKLMNLFKLLDKMDNLRKDMVLTCIHPYDELRYSEDGTVQCTFCSKRLLARTETDTE